MDLDDDGDLDLALGQNRKIVVADDFNGDGRADPAVFDAGVYVTAQRLGTAIRRNSSSGDCRVRRPPGGPARFGPAAGGPPGSAQGGPGGSAAARRRGPANAVMSLDQGSRSSTAIRASGRWSGATVSPAPSLVTLW